MRSWLFVFLLLMQPAFAESSLTCVVTLTEQVGDFPPRIYENSESNISFNGNTVSSSDLKNKMKDPNARLVAYDDDWFLVKHCKIYDDILECVKGKSEFSSSRDQLVFDFVFRYVSWDSIVYLFNEELQRRTPFADITAAGQC